MMRLCSDLHGEIRHRLKLVRIPVHHRRVDLERQPRGTAVLHPAHRAVPAARERAKRIVLLFVERIERDAHPARARLLQRLRHRQVDQRAVRAEHGDQPQPACIGDQLKNIRACQRLTARKDHNAEPRLCDLAQELLALLGREFLVRAAARVTVAVRTVHIAGVRRIPRDNLHPAARDALRVPAGVTALSHAMRMSAGMPHSMRVTHPMRMPCRCALCGVRRVHRRAHSAAPATPISSSVR